MKAMTLSEFCMILKDALRSKLGKNCVIERSDVPRNNGVVAPCLLITIRQDGQNIYKPAVDIKGYHIAFCEGIMDMNEIVEDILTSISSVTTQEPLTQIQLFENYKDKVVFRLVNYQKNKEALSHKPHMRILDLAAEVMVVFKSIDAMMSVTNQLMEVWGISNEELFFYARENMKKNTRFVFNDLFQVVGACMSDADCEKGIAEEQELLDFKPLYILSNEEGIYGAIMMLCLDVLASCAEKLQSDLIILPSSVHEVLVMPSNSLQDLGELQQMVRDINQSEVDAKDVLSDNIYKYDREKKCLSMYSDGEENERFQIGDVFRTGAGQ